MLGYLFLGEIAQELENIKERNWLSVDEVESDRTTVPNGMPLSTLAKTMRWRK